jgi:hypothetical protein
LPTARSTSVASFPDARSQHWTCPRNSRHGGGRIAAPLSAGPPAPSARTHDRLPALRQESRPSVPMKASKVAGGAIGAKIGKGLERRPTRRGGRRLHVVGCAEGPKRCDAGVGRACPRTPQSAEPTREGEYAALDFRAILVTAMDLQSHGVSRNSRLLSSHCAFSRGIDARSRRIRLRSPLKARSRGSGQLGCSSRARVRPPGGRLRPRKRPRAPQYARSSSTANLPGT